MMSCRFGGAAPIATTRWIYLRMIEENARHNGHADLIRECIDGATGDGSTRRGLAHASPAAGNWLPAGSRADALASLTVSARYAPNGRPTAPSLPRPARTCTPSVAGSCATARPTNKHRPKRPEHARTMLDDLPRTTGQMIRRSSHEPGPCPPRARKGVTHGDSRSFTAQPAARLTCAAAGPAGRVHLLCKQGSRLEAPGRASGR